MKLRPESILPFSFQKNDTLPPAVGFGGDPGGLSSLTAGSGCTNEPRILGWGQEGVWQLLYHVLKGTSLAFSSPLPSYGLT